MGWLGAGAALSLLVVGGGAQRPGGQGAGGLHGRRLGTPPDALPNDGISHERRQRRRQHGGGPNSRPNGGSGGLGAGVSRLSPLQNVSVVVVTDLGTRRWLRAAQCTWLQLLDPGQVVTVTDFDLTAGAGLQGGCGFQVAHPLRVANAIDYLEVIRAVHSNGRKFRLQPWVLFVKPWTFVRPRLLSQLVSSARGSAAGLAGGRELGGGGTVDYAGNVRNATSELSALGHFPHVAYEYGLLLRLWCVRAVAQLGPFGYDDDSQVKAYLHTGRAKSDFLAMESSVTDISAALFVGKRTVTPTHLPEFYAALPDFSAASLEPTEASFVTIGPVEPLVMFDLMAALSLEGQARLGAAASQGAPTLGGGGYRGGGERRTRVDRSGRNASSSGGPLSDGPSQGGATTRRRGRVATRGPDKKALKEGALPDSPSAGPSISRGQAAGQRRQLGWAEGGLESPSPSKVDPRYFSVAEARHSYAASPRDDLASDGGTSDGGASDGEKAPRFLMAVLARENELAKNVEDALASWAGDPQALNLELTILFFYSTGDAPAAGTRGHSKLLQHLALARSEARRSWGLKLATSRRLQAFAGGSNQNFAGGGKSGTKPAGSLPVRVPGRQLPPPIPPGVKGRWVRRSSKKDKKREKREGGGEVENVENEGGDEVELREFEHRFGNFSYSVSEEFAPRGSLASIRMVGLNGLPAQPSASSTFYTKSMAKPMAWHYWLRAKVQFLVQSLTLMFPGGADGPDAAPGWFTGEVPDWFIVVDDDTYIKVPEMSRLLGHHDAGLAVAVGRKFFSPGKGGLLGGGPGIALSRGALGAIETERCQSFPVISHSVPGGDGWLGQCMSAAGVTLIHDWRFKSLPPLAFSKEQQAWAASFHKSNVRSVASWLAGRPKAGQTNALTPMCAPALLRDLKELTCIPRFTIIGAQKAGTTSIFEYLGQHPNVRLPEEKELNFWGSPWPIASGLKRATPLSKFTFSYFRKFKLPPPNLASRVTGEASPDYFVATIDALFNMLRYAPSMKVIVSLRDPIERFASAYKNKVADGTMHRHMDQRLFATKKKDTRKDHEVPDFEVPSLSALVTQASEALQQCPDQGRHYTLSERPVTWRDGKSCYVNPFVLHGHYAKYLRPWVANFGGARHNLFIMDFAALESSAEGAAGAMAELAHFLGLKPFAFTTGEVYNSRENRGVHTKKGLTGGVISGVPKEQLGGKLGSWTKLLPPDSVAALQGYYRRPVKELVELLRAEGRQVGFTKNYI